MAHGENAKFTHKEWWGKRPLSYTPHYSGKMRKVKRHLHKIERQQRKQELRKVSDARL